MTETNIINQIPITMWSPVYNWSFISCCLCLAIIILTAKRATSQIAPVFYSKGAAHGMFTLTYLFLGLVSAIPKTYLHGVSYFDRAIVGVIASGVSLAVYHAIIKRLSSVIGVKENFLDDPDEKVSKPDEAKVPPQVEAKP